MAAFLVMSFITSPDIIADARAIHTDMVQTYTIDEVGLTRFLKGTTEAVIFIKNGGSCEKCSYIAEKMKVEAERRNISTILLIVVNRLKDSVATGHANAMQSPIYITRSEFHTYGDGIKEDGWYYFSSSSPNVQSGSFTEERSMERFLSVLRGGIRVQRQVLSTLDETRYVLGRPVFNLYIRDSILVVGSDNEMRLDAYNIQNGMHIWHADIPDSMFAFALSPGECIERDILLYTPGIWAAEWLDSGRVAMAGRIVSRRIDSVQNRRMVGRRSFIAIIDTTTFTAVAKCGQMDMSREMRTRSMTNTQWRYPYLYTSTTPWDAKDDAVYDSYMVTRMNVISGETELYSPLDSVYRILQIEDNVSNGYFCIVDGELWTAQPLSPRIHNEVTGKSMDLAGTHYEKYYEKMRSLALGLSDISVTAMQRFQRYEIQSYIKGIFAAGDSQIAVISENDSNKVILEIYDTAHKVCIWRENVSPGWTLQRGDDSIVRIELEGDDYIIVEYTLSRGNGIR